MYFKESVRKMTSFTPTKYEDQNGHVSNKAIRDYMEDMDLMLTTDFKVAIYLLTDGSLISGKCAYSDNYNGRDLDHHVITALIAEGQNYYQLSDTGIFWQALQDKTGMVMLVPETKEALIAKNQTLTPIQKQLIQANNYHLDTYI